MEKRQNPNWDKLQNIQTREAVWQYTPNLAKQELELAL
jgi:hypothetical protein